jgi:hypothetical protein
MPAGGSPNEQTADPRYANAAAGDLHLLTGSPALGYTDTVFSPAVDYDGTPRLPAQRMQVPTREPEARHTCLPAPICAPPRARTSASESQPKK